mmetsp:Transcript_74455/g.174755  ORF Transcript_74455/g.174755 Transcript_74455/m.174755 type:complete len:211 (-) Transcript_74455:653-1285(-)
MDPRISGTLSPPADISVVVVVVVVPLITANAGCGATGAAAGAATVSSGGVSGAVGDMGDVGDMDIKASACTGDPELTASVDVAPNAASAAAKSSGWTRDGRRSPRCAERKGMAAAARWRRRCTMPGVWLRSSVWKKERRAVRFSASALTSQKATPTTSCSTTNRAYLPRTPTAMRLAASAAMTRRNALRSSVEHSHSQSMMNGKPRHSPR